MKSKVNLTISPDILLELKRYAQERQTSISSLFEEFAGNLLNTRKRKSILDWIDEIPDSDKYPEGFDFKKEYYEEKIKKYESNS